MVAASSWADDDRTVERACGWRAATEPVDGWARD